VFDSFRFGVGDTVAVAARGVACGGLVEVEEMAEGEAFGVQSWMRVRMNGICGRGAVCRVGLAYVGFETLPPCA